MHTVQLIPRFEPRQLQADYAAIRQLVEGQPAGYPGEGHVGWRSICVHALPDGASALLAHAPYLRAVIEELGLTVRLARLLALEPGGVIREHQDAFLSRRIVRLHLPVATNPGAYLRVAGTTCRWGEGELWYGDFSQLHEGANDGDTTRVHLVLDVTADARLCALFPPDQLPAELHPLDEAQELDLDSAQLARFVFDFLLPAGFTLPGTGLQPLEQVTAGRVDVVDSELCVFVNQQPLLKAMPLSEETLALLGLGAEAQLRYTFDARGARTVALALGAHVVHVFDIVGQRSEAA